MRAYKLVPILASSSLALLATAAPARGEAPASQPAPADAPRAPGFVGDPAPTDGVPRGSYVVVDDPGLPPPAWPDTVVHHAPIIFYLNKGGGTYVPGNNDARTNRSSIVSQTRTIPPWNVSASGWSQVMSCMTTMFQRWNVTITDVDPGNVPHYEIVVAGRPQDLGMQAGVGGVSPFSCGVINNSIVFTFAEVYGTNYRSVCETNAQEIAHSFGLDHERLCQDPMTYLTGCGAKSFQNVAAPCGEYSNRQCQCGGSTQNSVALLDQRLGLRETTSPDAGPTPMVDAGPTPMTDAGLPPTPDAGPVAPDAGDPAGADAGDNPADPDAGADAGEITAGCGCASGGSGATPRALLLALVVLAVLGRRRGRPLAQPRLRT
ncbi:MAG: hypothetical protein KJZ91_30950 [Myxococcales bacterium]|nr:hypothetical protein [Myxococcales bacterium]